SGTLMLTNTIVANSGNQNCSGTIADGGHNLQFSAQDCGATIPSADPFLDPAGLADHGGPTQTIAVLAGSPAIDAGDETVCATTTGTAPVANLDQRGFTRPGQGATQCSIGAFEFAALL